MKPRFKLFCILIQKTQSVVFNSTKCQPLELYCLFLRNKLKESQAHHKNATSVAYLLNRNTLKNATNEYNPIIPDKIVFISESHVKLLMVKFRKRLNSFKNKWSSFQDENKILYWLKFSDTFHSADNQYLRTSTSPFGKEKNKPRNKNKLPFQERHSQDSQSKVCFCTYPCTL